MKKYSAAILLISFFVSSPVLAAPQANTSTLPMEGLRKPALAVFEETTQKPRWFANSYNELGWVTQGNRQGMWTLLSNQASCAVTKWLMPYVGVDVWNRLGQRDNIITGGAYFKFKDKSYLRAEMGWGADITYVYRWQATLEYEHPLYKGLSGNISGRYLNYPVNDVWIQSPGLRYYFKDHYIGVAYNVAETMSRGTAQSVAVKGHYAFCEWFNLEAGTAFGERVYDIFELPASKQYGYILFTRGEVHISKNLSAQVGFAYSHERPSFIKRDLTLGLSLKF